MKISGIFDTNVNISLMKSLASLQSFLSYHKFFLAKLSCSFLMLLFFSQNSVNLFPFYFHSEENFSCIYDVSFKWSSPINRFLEENLFIKKILIIYSSFLMDTQFFFIMITFCCLARNLRFPMIFISFYLLRGILQSLFVFGFPEDYIWGHPGFFSLTISYAKTSDFFYSGHVGSSVLCYFEFSRYEFFEKRFAYLKYFSLNCCITQCLVQIIFRGHYVIDVISGFVFAHYFYILVGDKVDGVEDDRKILLKDWRNSKKKELNNGKVCRRCKKKD